MILTMIPLGLSTMDLTWGPILGRGCGHGVAVDLPVGHWSVIIRFRGDYKNEICNIIQNCRAQTPSWPVDQAGLAWPWNVCWSVIIRLKMKFVI